MFREIALIGSVVPLDEKRGSQKAGVIEPVIPNRKLPLAEGHTCQGCVWPDE